MANPYQRPGFKDPRETAQESASALSSYFQDKADKQPKTVSPYSAPAEPAGGSAPSGGGPSAPSAPKGSAGGGTGFVSFGQYFGANAPAIQQQAQQFVQPGSVQRQARAGGASPKEDPYAAQIAQTSARFAELNPAAQSGDMGKNVSAFDQLLGGGETQRAAKQEQQRLGTLRSALEGDQAQWQQGQARAEEAKKQAETSAQQREQTQAKQEQDTLGLAKAKAFKQTPPGTSLVHSKESWWNSLSKEEQQYYLDEANAFYGAWNQEKAQPEYASLSQD